MGNLLRSIVFVLFALGFTLNGISQQTINFPSKDGLTITADLYVVDIHKPYILLLHQAGYSRGEYREIAPKLTKLGYNCLAIDQRSGYEVNYVKNETAKLAKEKGLPTDYLDALQDVEAALDYIKSKTDLPIVIWGSSYSASLALVETAINLRIKAAIVFSPGEYFDQENFIKSKISKISVPILVLSSKEECAMVKEVCEDVKPNLKTFFCPSDVGRHGSKALWSTNPSSKDYWMTITMFFSKL
ncbi:MAG: alpha/beta hydrolase [Bacteroidales bacterium]